ncbi:MAG TPA: Gfo/Idh/MocA family oxidoreductase [Ruminiclostridium sp.]
MQKIKVGIIGTGFIGPVHIDALRRLGFVEVAAIADINEEVAKQKAEQLNVPQYYGDYHDLLRNKEIQAVHICTPNYLHFQICKDALSAGKHIVCEKPLAINIKEAEELVCLADEKELVNAVHFNLRFYPLIHEARAMVEKGELGRIVAINGSYQQDWLLYETDYSWRLQPELSGESRAVADIGSHWCDMIEYISGSKITEICSDFAIFYPVRKKPKKAIETYSGKLLSEKDYDDICISTEDYASVLLRFDNNAHGTLTVNQMAAGRKNRLFFEIYGTKKSIAWNSEKPNEMWIGKRDGNNEVLIKDPSLMSPYASDIACFPGGHNEGFPDTSKQMFKKVYNYIINNGLKNGQEPDFPTFKSGLRELEICERMIQSSKDRKWLAV